MAKRTVIHVNQHIIKANAKNGETKPALTVKDYRENRKAHEAIIYDKDGEEVARVVFADGVNRKPLDCGARVWIETTHAVATIDWDEAGIAGPDAEEDVDIDDPTAVIDPEVFATAAARY